MKSAGNRESAGRIGRMPIVRSFLRIPARFYRHDSLLHIKRGV
jgi:hypothetical protein